MKPITRREALQLGVAASSVCLLGHTQAQAQSLPESARILVGFPPGGGIDLIARRLAEQLTGKLAKAVIVDNRPGAAGRIAVDVARQSPPDGLTLLMNPAGVLTINPHTFKKSNYDPFKDFTALSLAALIDFGFAVGAGVSAEVKTLADFAIRHAVTFIAFVPSTLSETLGDAGADLVRSSSGARGSRQRTCTASRRSRSRSSPDARQDARSTARKSGYWARR